MARAKSVVLSREEKSQIVRDLRSDIKQLKTVLKNLGKETKAAEKSLAKNEVKLAAIRAK